ncbi:hypothetical protein D3C83_328480 [compost metagenome]
MHIAPPAEEPHQVFRGVNASEAAAEDDDAVRRLNGVGGWVHLPAYVGRML